jgi:hypothetical protein
VAIFNFNHRDKPQCQSKQPLQKLMRQQLKGTFDDLKEGSNIDRVTVVFSPN